VWITYGKPTLYGNRETDLILKLDINLSKSVDHENEVNIRWCKPG